MRLAISKKTNASSDFEHKLPKTLSWFNSDLKGLHACLFFIFQMKSLSLKKGLESNKKKIKWEKTKKNKWAILSAPKRMR